MLLISSSSISGTPFGRPGPPSSTTTDSDAIFPNSPSSHSGRRRAPSHLTELAPFVALLFAAAAGSTSTWRLSRLVVVVAALVGAIAVVVVGDVVRSGGGAG